MEEIVEDIKGLIEEPKVFVLTDESGINKLSVLFEGLSVLHEKLNGFVLSEPHSRIEILVGPIRLLQGLSCLILHHIV
jgi:hypothetical protein